MAKHISETTCTWDEHNLAQVMLTRGLLSNPKLSNPPKYETKSQGNLDDSLYIYNHSKFVLGTETSAGNPTTKDRDLSRISALIHLIYIIMFSVLRYEEI